MPEHKSSKEDQKLKKAEDDAQQKPRDEQRDGDRDRERDRERFMTEENPLIFRGMD